MEYCYEKTFVIVRIKNAVKEVFDIIRIEITNTSRLSTFYSPLQKDKVKRDNLS